MRTGKNPWRLRKCKNKACGLTYSPTAKDAGNAEKSKFCCVRCKNYYHRHGGINAERLHEVVYRRISKALLTDDSFLEAIADKVRVISAPGISIRETIQGIVDRPH